MKVLFICSQGKYRSRTAADYFKSVWGWDTDFAGTDIDAVKRVTESQVREADLIICMENSHRNKIRRKWKGLSKKIKVWGIEDEYYYYDPLLLSELLCRMRSLSWYKV